MLPDASDCVRLLRFHIKFVTFLTNKIFKIWIRLVRFWYKDAL